MWHRSCDVPIINKIRPQVNTTEYKSQGSRYWNYLGRLLKSVFTTYVTLRVPTIYITHFPNQQTSFFGNWSVICVWKHVVSFDAFLKIISVINNTMLHVIAALHVLFTFTLNLRLQLLIDARFGSWELHRITQQLIMLHDIWPSTNYFTEFRFHSLCLYTWILGIVGCDARGGFFDWRVCGTYDMIKIRGWQSIPHFLSLVWYFSGNGCRRQSMLIISELRNMWSI